MTEREKQMIEAYIPNPRDESLDWDEYYVRRGADEKIFKVHIREINPCGEETHYGVYTEGGKRICDFTGDGDYPKRHMYDNKSDCKEGTHDFYDGWERLREIENQQ